LKKLYHNWRYYELGRNDYETVMDLVFPKITVDLFKTNILVAILTAFFAIFPILTENNFYKSRFYILSAIIAITLSVISSYRHKKHSINAEKKNYRHLYILLLLYFANIMFIGLYLAVFAERAKIAGSFIGILICALLPFTISPILYLCLTISIVILYIVLILLFKVPSVWNYDIQNAVFAGTVSVFFGWHFIKHRVTSALNISKLEAENTIDALTQLKNRKDFMQTFQRRVFNHRPTDKYLCIALLDIDCYKNYNDYYGHPQGDECLRVIGKALKELHINKGIYAARVGGEEFALLWNIEEESEADNVGAYINGMIKDLNIPNAKSIVAPYLTVSIGIHIARCGIPHDITELYSFADKSLYKAKNNGRNCAVISSENNNI